MPWIFTPASVPLSLPKGWSSESRASELVCTPFILKLINIEGKSGTGLLPEADRPVPAHFIPFRLAPDPDLHVG